jgi:hypothetical protein
VTPSWPEPGYALANRNYQTKYGQQSQFNPTAIDPLTGRSALRPTGPLASRDANNFQPRIGMPTSVTTGFCGKFAVNALDLWTNGLRENFEYLATAVFESRRNPDIASSRRAPDQLQHQPDGSVPFIGSNYSGQRSYFDQHAFPHRTGTRDSRQFGTNYLLEFTYQGSAGVGLLNRWDINQIPECFQRPGAKGHPAGRPELKPYAVRQHNHYATSATQFPFGTVKLEKRMSSGLSFTRSTPWARRSTKTATTPRPAVTYYNRRLEKRGRISM